MKRILFTLIPVTLLLATAELATRAFELDRATVVAGGSGLGPNSMVQPDVDLGWVLQPSTTTELTHVSGRYTVSVNRHGLRSPEIEARRENDLRILSLGESSTLGIGVENDETYSALLQEQLDRRLRGSSVEVINAGVSAYSSTQSLIYLRTEGLALRPDAILFYHEVNDYLPSAMRDTESNEVGVLLTDKQLYDSPIHRWNRTLLTVSALHRFLVRSYARWLIDRLELEQAMNPVREIGLPDMRVGALVIDKKKRANRSAIAFKLGRRVSDEERVQNLAELIALSEQHGIELLIIHPSYRGSSPHECVLTEFAQARGIQLFDAHASLHPSDDSRPMYLDPFHPSRWGHQRLATGLAAHLVDRLRERVAKVPSE